MHKRIVIGVITLVVIVISVTGYLFFIRPSTEGDEVVKSVESFTPFMPGSNSVEGFTIKQGSVKYENNVLLFELVDKKSDKSLIVTEQRTPENYDIDALQADDEFKNQY